MLWCASPASPSMASSGDLITYWFNSAGKFKVLPKEQVIALSRKIHTADSSETERRRAINTLCRHNMKIVVHLTMKFLKKNTNFKHYDDRVADYLQVGALGLHKACLKYDATMGYEFSTYAGRWIRSYLQRHHYAEWSMIHVPENVVTMYNNPEHPKAQSKKMKYRIACAGQVRHLMELDRPVDTGSNEVISLKDIIPDPKSLLVD